VWNLWKGEESLGAGGNRSAILNTKYSGWLWRYLHRCMVTGFPSDVDEIYALLGYCTEYSGNLVPTFRDNLAVPSSRVRKSKKNDSYPSYSILKMVTLGCTVSQRNADLSYGDNFCLHACILTLHTHTYIHTYIHT